jgi:TonB dependent receptor-like, beta-barrel
MFGRRTKAEVAYYVNQSHNVISSAASAQNPELLGYNPYYTSENPPPGWPLPPMFVDLLASQGIQLLAVVKTLNLGGLTNRGVEFSISHSFNAWLSGYANYSFQDTPKQREKEGDPLRIPSVSIGVAPPNRYNVNLTANRSRYIGVVELNHADKAFWTDVLSEQYYGYSRPYTMVNATFGVRWADGKITTSVKALNIANQQIQQHNFGDILKRSVMAEVRFGPW